MAPSIQISSLKKRRKRSFTLIEVLIALALVTTAMLPLLYPHYAIVREERKFVQEIELDRVSNLLFADLLEAFYRKQVQWESIAMEYEVPEAVPLDSPALSKLGMTGERRIQRKIGKPGKAKRYHLVRVEFRFRKLRESAERLFEYWVVVDHPTDSTIEKDDQMFDEEGAFDEEET